MPDYETISLAAYTRASETDRRLRVKVYPDIIPGARPRVQISVGDIDLHLDEHAARTLVDTITRELHRAAVNS